MDDSKIVSLYWDRNEQSITESEEKYGEYCYRIAFYILNEKSMKRMHLQKKLLY